MSLNEIPAAHPHSASLISIVLIEAMTLYASYGAILLAASVAVGSGEFGSYATSPRLETTSLELFSGPIVHVTAPISYATPKPLNAPDYQSGSSTE